MAQSMTFTINSITVNSLFIHLTCLRERTNTVRSNYTTLSAFANFVWNSWQSQPRWYLAITQFISWCRKPSSPRKSCRLKEEMKTSRRSVDRLRWRGLVGLSGGTFVYPRCYAGQISVICSQTQLELLFATGQLNVWQKDGLFKTRIKVVTIHRAFRWNGSWIHDAVLLVVHCCYLLVH